MKMVVNAIGEVCPIPVVKAKKAMVELKEDGVLEVLVDNETAVENLGKLAQQKGYEVSSRKTGDGNYSVEFVIKNTGAATENSGSEAKAKKTVVVISSDHMGEGSEELGKMLMKSFLFALSEQEILPDTMLFYNGGAKLTCTGSDSLEDLNSLAGKGVKIFTCGTCLNHYELTEKLAVGEVTNMYVIAETMLTADLIVKP